MINDGDVVAGGAPRGREPEKRRVGRLRSGERGEYIARL